MKNNDHDNDAKLAQLDSLRRRVAELESRRAGRQTGEDGLYRGDENYRTLVQNLDVGIYRNTGGPKGCFLRANPAMPKMFGYESVEDFLQASVADLYANPEEREGFVEEVIREGVVRNRVLLLRRRDGSRFWGACTATAQYGADGSLTWIDGMIQDVTQSRETEEALRFSSEKLTKILRHMPVVVTVTTLADGRFIEVNRNFERATGYSSQEVLGKTAEAIGLWKDDTTRNEFLAQVARKGYAKKIAIKVNTKTGQPKTGLLSADPIMVDGQKCLLSVVTDITESTQAIEALRESEEKFAKAFRQSPFWVLITTLEQGRYVEMNEAFLHSMGYTREELLGKTTLETGLWVDPLVRQEVVQEIKRTGSVSQKEVEFRGKYGVVKTMLFSSEEIVLSGERCMVSVNVDITERKLAEKAVKQSEEEYRILVENQTDLLVKVDLEGRFLFVSPSYCRLFGKSEAELLGKKFMPLVHVEDREATAKAMEDLYKPPHTAHLEQRAYTRDGWRWLSWMDTAVLDDRGEVTAIIGVGRDVTERRKALRALRESEEKYRTLTQNMQDVVFLVQDGIIQHINDRVVELAGYTAQELIGSNFLDFVAPEYRELMAEMQLRRLAGEKVPNQQEIAVLAKNGSQVQVNSYISSVNYEGGPAAMGTLKDITEIRRAEEEKAKLQAQLQHSQKMEAIGTLASGIAHDFNNILQGIRGYAQLLKLHAGQPGQVVKHSSDIDYAVARATDLIQRMLAFGRKLEPELVPMDLNLGVNEAVIILERTIPKMITIESELAPDLLPINGDANQLELIILNLANNAADAMPQGGRLIIRTENISLDEAYCKQHLDAVPGEYVCLSITDTGHGMDAAVLSRIFDPFYTTKEVGQGTGLGLSIVYGIVSGHGGHLTCYSEPEAGTTFRIYLPVAAGTPLRRERKGEGLEDILGGSETIMVVDDEKVILEVVQETLSHFGYTVITAGSGEEALVLHDEKGAEIDLVIMDIGMPGMGGIRCLQELKARQPDLKVLVASGYSQDGRLKDIKDQGAAGFVAKPYRSQELMAAVRQILDAGG
jgi:two-component system cell cycle sensor histidine kinase/response regulator CckA